MAGRVSSAKEDAFHMKGSFADGWGEVIGSKALVFQFPPNKTTGNQDPPALYCQLEIQRYRDGDFKEKEGNGEGEEVLLKIAGPSKETGQLEDVHVGDCADGNVENEPSDGGNELGAEGNTLYAVKDGYQINDKVKYMQFCVSLEEKGFKPSILKRTFFPDFVGLRAFFKTITLKKFRDDMTNDPTAFVVTEIKQFPYEQKAGKAVTGKKEKDSTSKQKSTSAPKSSAKASESASDSATEATGSATDATDATDAESIATDVLTRTFATAKAGATIADVKKLKVEVFMAMSKHKPAIPAEMKKSVMDQLGQEDWLIATGMANGVFELDGDKIVVTK